jgi:hypothetical protein
VAIAELSACLSPESVQRIVHPSPPRAKTLNDSQELAQTG